jgi:hypothetical protein
MVMGSTPRIFERSISLMAVWLFEGPSLFCLLRLIVHNPDQCMDAVCIFVFG